MKDLIYGKINTDREPSEFYGEPVTIDSLELAEFEVKMQHLEEDAKWRHDLIGKFQKEFNDFKMKHDYLLTLLTPEQREKFEQQFPE